jgi:hypothetical protein
MKTGMSRKDAKAQRSQEEEWFLIVFFAPWRLCVTSFPEQT